MAEHYLNADKDEHGDTAERERHADALDIFIISREKYNIEHAEYHKEEREERDVYIEVGGVDGGHNFSAQECYRHADRYLEQFEQAHGDYAGEHCFMLFDGQHHGEKHIVILSAELAHEEHAEAGIEHNNEIWVVRNKEHECERNKQDIRRMKDELQFFVEQFFHFVSPSLSICTIISSSPAGADSTPAGSSEFLTSALMPSFSRRAPMSSIFLGALSAEN